MNYYIQGNKEKADQIKAAFEKLGYNTRELNFSDGFFYTVERDVHYCIYDYMVNIIKTHHDYQELELPKPEFKVGDWVVKKDGTAFYGGNYAEQVTLIEGDEYLKCIWLSSTSWVRDNDIRLWTIQDAKDGDVLSTDGIICIFKKLDKDGYYIISPCIYTVKDGLEVIDDEDDSIGSCGFKPATKEDRKLLFRKMKEAGYEWNAEKKELRKIEPHYNISNFKPFDKVLERNYDTDSWTADLFSHYVDDEDGKAFVTICSYRNQCIPFEGNEHLLGTTDMPDEMYINW